MKTCPKCSASNEEGQKFCLQCGQSIISDFENQLSQHSACHLFDTLSAQHLDSEEALNSLSEADINQLQLPLGDELKLEKIIRSFSVVNLKNSQFLVKQHAKLIKLRVALSSTVVRKEISEESFDDDGYDLEFALTYLSNTQGAFYEVSDALKWLDEGNYGTCEGCNKLIKQESLKMLPFARYCVACQSSIETSKKSDL